MLARRQPSTHLPVASNQRLLPVIVGPASQWVLARCKVGAGGLRGKGGEHMPWNPWPTIQLNPMLVGESRCTCTSCHPDTCSLAELQAPHQQADPDDFVCQILNNTQTCLKLVDPRCRAPLCFTCHRQWCRQAPENPQHTEHPGDQYSTISVTLSGTWEERKLQLGVKLTLEADVVRVSEIVPGGQLEGAVKQGDFLHGVISGDPANDPYLNDPMSMRGDLFRMARGEVVFRRSHWAALNPTDF